MEPFSDTQVDRWLAVWNAANCGYLADHRLWPLRSAVALSHRERATQPLLLLMLALYDADGNALQADTAHLGPAEDPPRRTP